MTAAAFLPVPAAPTHALPGAPATAAPDEGALITIVGAGFTGTAIAVQQIHAYLAAWQRDAGAVAPLTLRLVEKSGTAGPGLPYATADDIFLLNQPAWAMSPFPQDPAHFTRWRAEHGLGDDADAFERRSVYGRYLRDIFAQAVRHAAESGAPIAVQTVRATVETLSFRPDGGIALDTPDAPGESAAPLSPPPSSSSSSFSAPRATSDTPPPASAPAHAPSPSVMKPGAAATPPPAAPFLNTDPGPRASDAVIIADGHQKSTFLQELRGDEYYFEPPFSVTALREKLDGRDGTVVIVGTSQSMLDALAALDHIGWAGRVRAVSRDLVLPWPFHPSHYGADSGYAPYAPAVLTAGNIAAAATENDPATAARALVQEELEHAAANGYDTGHVVTAPAVYAAIDAAARNAQQDAQPDTAAAALCRALRDQLAKIYGNPTPPARYALFRRWLDSGRLELARDDIAAAKIEKNGTEKTAAGNAPPQAEEKGRNDNGRAAYTLHTPEGPLRLAAIFNGACFTRDPLASPLLRQAYEAGQLRWDAAAAQPAAGRQSHPGLYVAGPAAHRDKWGVETFRDECRDTALDSLAHALARHRPAAPAPL